MRQTKELNKHAPGRVVTYISVHLVSIYTSAFSNVLLILALDFLKFWYIDQVTVNAVYHDVKWEPLFYLESEHIPSKWENTHSNMQVLTEIKKSHCSQYCLIK